MILLSPVTFFILTVKRVSNRPLNYLRMRFMVMLYFNLFSAVVLFSRK